MLLQAALNGPFDKHHHPTLPESVEELAQDSADCVVAGARAVHLHPRDAAGAESLAAGIVDAVVAAVRSRCGVPVGVTTGEWIEPDLARRIALIGAWSEPDYASVNVSEAGAADVMRVLLEAGIGIEAGVWSVEDVERLGDTGFADRITRVLVEPVDVLARDAVEIVEEIHGALDRAGITAPRLEHGDGDATWVLVGHAIQRGLDTRIGLEDTTLGPDGSRASGNAALVSAARELGAGQ
jgi:uncharacterized protein (DUF849 family)